MILGCDSLIISAFDVYNSFEGSMSLICGLSCWDLCFLVHQIFYWDILLKFFDLFLSLLFGYVFYYCIAANRCNLRRIPFHRNAAMGPMGGVHCISALSFPGFNFLSTWSLGRYLLINYYALKAGSLCAYGSRTVGRFYWMNCADFIIWNICWGR